MPADTERVSWRRRLSHIAKRRGWLAWVMACLGLLLFAGQARTQSPDDPLATLRKKAEQWEGDIQAFEGLDQREPDPENGILFVGSSSIRLWDTIARDMRPWPVVKRGFGGCKFSDIAVYAERLIQPHHYRALVLFSANDVTGKEEDNSPTEFSVAVQHVIDVAKRHQPDAPIFLIAVTPSESRWTLWDRIQGSNRTLKEMSMKNSGVHFVDTVATYLNEQGKPRAEFFKEDKLHQNELGYAHWSRHIKNSLLEVFGDRSPRENRPNDPSLELETSEPISREGTGR